MTDQSNTTATDIQEDVVAAANEAEKANEANSTQPEETPSAPQLTMAERIAQYSQTGGLQVYGGTDAAIVSKIKASGGKVISAGKGDVLRRTHAEAYLELFSDEEHGADPSHDPMMHAALKGLTVEQLQAIVTNGASALSVDDRKARAEYYSHLKGVFQWLKGIAAAALIVKAIEAEDAAADAGETVQPAESPEELVERATGETPDQSEVERIEEEADDNAEGAGEADEAEAEAQQED